MRILVTGAPGWLGTRLVETLTGAGASQSPPPFADAEVRCLLGPGIDGAEVERLGASTKRGDLTNAATLDDAVEGAVVVFHLAGIIHAHRRTSDLFELNTTGTENLLQAAVSAGVRRFVYVSSNSAGGVNTRRHQLMTEKDVPRPYMAYGRSKLQAEEAVQARYREGAIETVIIRPCWFYGPGQPLRQTRLFRMIKGGRPVLFGDGNNLRSMSYVDNTVDGLVRSAQTPAANGQIYWIADERPYPTIEIYETIARLLEVEDLRPRYVPDIVSWGLRLGDRVLQRAGFYQQEVHVAGELNLDIACSVDKAERELGYAPRVALEEGMRRSIDWCRANGIDI